MVDQYEVVCLSLRIGRITSVGIPPIQPTSYLLPLVPKPVSSQSVKDCMSYGKIYGEDEIGMMSGHLTMMEWVQTTMNVVRSVPWDR
jgi:hypothetical protein